MQCAAYTFMIQNDRETNEFTYSSNHLYSHERHLPTENPI